MTRPGRVSAVLFDADGVLQHVDHDWATVLDAWGGVGFADVVFEQEVGALRGSESLRACLERVVESRAPHQDVDALLALWLHVRVDDEALAIVDELRDAGVRCFLATNQQDARRDLMLRSYGSRFDGYGFSCDLGAMKPEQAYFDALFEAHALDPRECVFLDDSVRNVEAGRQAGLHAVQHDPTSGAGGVRRALRTYGLNV